MFAVVTLPHMNVYQTCGTCTNDCDAAVSNVVTVTCTAGACGYDTAAGSNAGCATDYSDCNGDVTDGCEVSLQTDTAVSLCP